MYSLCQRCGRPSQYYWQVHQAEFHVGAIQHWKVQLCDDCAKHVEQEILKALRLEPKP